MNFQDIKNKAEAAGFRVTPTDISAGFTPEMARALGEGVDLNNAAYMASNNGDHATAVEKYRKAIDIKLKAYGEDSIHVCISLSGLSDAYLALGDKANAMKEAKRMMVIAKKLNNAEQVRIAREIMTDVLKAS